MAFEIGSAVAKIKADTTDFQQGIKQVEGGMSGLGSVVGKLGLALAGVFAVTKIVDFGKDIVDSAQKAQVEMAKVDAIIKTVAGTSKTAFTNIKKYSDMAGQSMIQLGFDDEDAQVAFVKLFQATQDTTEANKLLAMSADLARFKGIDLATAQNAVMLATQGNTKLLKQMGIELSDNATKEEALAGIQSRVAGQAEAYSKTYAGALSTFNIQWTNLKETLGEKLLPILTTLMGKFGEAITFLQGVFSSTGQVNDIFATLQQTWSDFVTFTQPLMAWFTATVVPMLQSIWAEFMYFVNIIVPPVIAIIKFLVYEIIVPILTFLRNFWVEHWDFISAILTATWNIIVNVIKLAWAVIAGVFSTFLLLITGNWQGAWDNMKHYLDMAWGAIKGIFGGMIDYLRGWGGWLYDMITEPFRKAWDTVRDLVNKIKDALDFTKRHSPSVVDIVERGVGLVNGALNDLKVGIQPLDTGKMALAGIGGGASMPTINIDFSGAYVGDDSIGERIGDAIISKLQKNVRF